MKIALLAIFHFACASKRPRNAKFASKNQRPNPRSGKGKTNAQNARQKSQSKNQQNAPTKKSKPKQPARNSSNGGTLDKFPKGNLQGMNFRSGKTSRETDMEMIGEITSTSTAFTVNSTFACNPGQSGTFPWLSKKAQLYEKYQFVNLEFIFKPEVSQYANLGQTGKVILSFDYDASDAPPSSKQNAEDTDPSADGMPYQEIHLKMRPNDLHKNSDAKFVRPAGLPGGSDIKTYDCGNLYVSTSGLEANSGTLGELWVKYDCILTVPILESVTSAPTNYFITHMVDSVATLTTTVAYQVLFAATSSTARSVVNGIGVVNTNGSIVPPPGNYMLTVNSVSNNTNGILSEFYMGIYKNTILQNPITSTEDGAITCGMELASAVNGVFSLSYSLYLNCNGTDNFTVSIGAVFASGTTTVVTNYLLVAI